MAMDAYTLLVAVGTLVVVREALSFLYVLYKGMIRPPKKLTKYGKWAVVTGATDGIGKAVSFELARRGCSVVLVSRTQSKLDAVAAELKDTCPNVEVKTEAVDFGNLSKERLSALEASLAELEVGVLFNNVGVSYDFSQWFHELLDDEVEALLKLNVESTTWMTRLVLPGMVKRKSGAIINQSSAAARFPLPLLAGYSAAKGYIENLTRSCHGEYEAKGIHFQCQSPLWVATPMVFPNSKVPPEKRATLMVPTTRKYAKCAVNAIGYDVLVSPYWVHELAIWVGNRLPNFLVVQGILKMHLAVRFNKKCVAKMEEKQKKKQ